MVVWTATTYASTALQGHCSLCPARKPWRTVTQSESVRHRLKQTNRRCSGALSSASDVRCSTDSETTPQHVSRRTLGLSAAALVLAVSSFSRQEWSTSTDAVDTSLPFVAIQISQSAQARNASSYDLAATNQQVRQYSFCLASIAKHLATHTTILAGPARSHRCTAALGYSF